MTSALARAARALLLACGPLAAFAAGAAPDTVDDRPRGGEPEVRRNVAEDDNVRIEELRVRGQVQRVVVTPKVGLRQPYEINPGDPARDGAATGVGHARASGSSAGVRVWNLLNF